MNLIPPGPLDHHFVNEAAEQGFPLRLRQDIGGPESRQRGANGPEGGLQGGGEGVFRRRPGLGALLVGRFGLFEGLQGHLPRMFQLRRDMAMGGVDVAELAFTIGGSCFRSVLSLGRMPWWLHP